MGLIVKLSIMTLGIIRMSLCCVSHLPFVMLSVIMQSVIVLNVIMLIVIVLIVITLSVVAPYISPTLLLPQQNAGLAKRPGTVSFMKSSLGWALLNPWRVF
jgi:hypothetical protein